VKRSEDPRYNAPPIMSELHGEARKRAQLDRHQSALDAYMARYRNPDRHRTFRDRLLDIFNPPIASVARPSATHPTPCDPSVEAGRITYIDEGAR